MSVLDEKERKESATWSDKEGPHFPMPDKAHARNALARIKFAGAHKEEVEKRARKILGKGRSAGRSR